MDAWKVIMQMVMQPNHVKANVLKVNSLWVWVIRMVWAGNSEIKWIGIEEIIDALDSFHARSWIVVHFSIAFKKRLEGQTAAFLLSKGLEDKAQESMKHAKKLAERIAELGEMETADPTEFVVISPFKHFAMSSSNSDVKEIFSFIQYF
jgi:ferritin-like protein